MNSSGAKGCGSMLFCVSSERHDEGRLLVRGSRNVLIRKILKQIQAMARFHPTLLLGAALANEISGEVR